MTADVKLLVARGEGTVCGSTALSSNFYLSLLWRCALLCALLSPEWRPRGPYLLVGTVDAQTRRQSSTLCENPNPDRKYRNFVMLLCVRRPLNHAEGTPFCVEKDPLNVDQILL